MGDFEKRISCKCICVTKKFLHKTIVPKKFHARTVGWKKNSGKMFPVLTVLFLDSGFLGFPYALRILVFQEGLQSKNPLCGGSTEYLL